jgi:hypothetical protein
MKEVFLNLSQDTKMVKKSDGIVAKQDISRKHIKKYCWKRKESEEKSTKEVNLAVTISGMNDQVLSVSTNLQYQEECQLDSGASHHMCSHRNWFISYEYVDGGVVFMGNGIPCKIVGVGSIRIRMFDGIARELTNVRYVPELKSNLISLGVFVFLWI